MYRNGMVVMAVALTLLLALDASAQQRPKRVKPTPFDEGKVSVSLAGGLSGEQGRIGGGVGYFVIKGLELSVDGSYIFGGETTNIGIVGPSARYIVWQVPQVHPYVGAFYRHWFIGNDLADRDSVGGRAGVVYFQAPFYVSGGVVYERFVGCVSGCSDIYPELVFAISF